MGVFKEITKADGSGVTVFYRTNLANTFDISDLDIDTESVLYRTGKEISEMTEDKPYIVLCTEDYIYTDQYGSLISVERGTVYEMEHGTVVDAISIGGGGGGGGIPRSNLSTANSPLEQNVSIKATVNLSVHFLTTALKKTGTAKLYVNNTLKSTKTVESGNDFEFDVSKYLKLGSNYFTIRTSDDNGAEKNFDFLVNAVQLILSSGFNGNIPIPNTFDYIYRIKGAGEKTVHFILDGVESTATTTTSDVDLTQRFTNLSHGSHTLEVYATAELDGEEMESNTLTYSLLTYNPASSEVIMLSNFDITSCMEGEQLKIDYLVYDPANLIANVSMYINDTLIMNTTADRTQHVWNVSNYPTGIVVFKIQCGTTYIEKEVEVEPISVDIHEATEGLELKLMTYNRSNQELEPGRSTWHYNDIYCQMDNFNWVTNGWIDNKLRLNGKANVVIPFQPFSTDLKRTGKTIELEFITQNAFDADSKLISCIDSNGVGFDVALDNSLLASEQQSVSTQFGVGNKIRISFVIESSSSNRLIKTYINGVLSGLKQYTNDDNFQQPIPTNIVINPNEEEIDITGIRIYNRALNSKEIINNWIYDMSDISEKINTFNRNQIYDYYGNISYAKVKNYLPIVIVTGSMPTYKGDKKKVKVQFERNDTTLYNFEQENCTIDVQGTSSQYYPRKNWKIKLVDKVQVGDGWLEEKTYCMKADFMESSHTYNIGTATLINDIYDPDYYYPTRTVDNGVRDTMNGFPCVLFTKEADDADMVFAGTFMFNNDKADTDTLGYTIDEQYKDTSESWEFKNNTSDHCLFKSADFSAATNPLDDFEARYPDGYEDFTALSRVFEWVVSCIGNPVKFKQEFDQYFDLHYCLVYQVMMETAIMVDSRAKNMFLDTADGIIWYPRFYDMDTCWGLNNEGVPAWSYDVEIHDRIGSAYVWDDRGASEFWNLFEEAYADEIKDMYHELRAEKLTYENILHYYIENISNEFSASEYNEDSEFKYIGPLLDEGNDTYLYAAQGNRQDYFKWIVEKRLIYLDSKYEYGDYNSDFATMRWYTTNGDITITTYQTMYIKVKFGSAVVKQRIEYNTPTVIHSPAGLEFNDTEVIIWGASQIKDFGDLTNKFAGTVDITKCAKLQRLLLGSSDTKNTNLISLSLGNNSLLRELYLINCSNLIGSLDLSGCTDLRVFNASGTGLSSFILPDSSMIEELYLPRSLTTLSLINIKYLQILNAQSFNNIRTLIFENTNYSLDDILSKCSSLSRLRVIFDDNYSSTMDIDGVMYYYNSMLGVDEHGDNLPHPYMAGTLNINIQNYHTEEEITEYKNIIANDMSGLIPNYQTINSLYSYYIAYAHDVTPTYVYIPISDGIFRKESNTGENAKTMLYGRTVSLNNIPAGTEYMGVYISNTNYEGIIYLPQTIRGIQVISFYFTGNMSYPNVTGLVIPNTYKMFDYDFYVNNNMISDGSGTSMPYTMFLRVSPTPAEFGSYYMIMRMDNVGFYYTNNPPKTNIRSIVFGGTVTIMPSLAGNYLEAFIDTENVKYWDWGHFDSTIKTSNPPFFPTNINNLKNIMVTGTYSYGCNIIPNSTRYIKNFNENNLISTATGTNTYNLYRGHYYGDLDCNWTYKSNTLKIASSMKIDNFNPRGITDVSSLGSSVSITKPFDATGITDIKITGFALPYTTEQNPQLFPDLINYHVSEGRVAADSDTLGSTPRYDYIEAPNLQTIQMNYQSSLAPMLGIKTDNLLKVIQSTDTGGSSSIGWHTYDAVSPWLSRGLDCSELDAQFILYLGKKVNNTYTVAEDLQNFGGLLNLGQGFTRARTITIAPYVKTYDAAHIKPILLNIFNNLYDLTSKNLTSTLSINNAMYRASGLTAEEIAIATNKGWTVVG